MPENVVTFRTDCRMTDWDIKNYLEKIYKVSIAGINSMVRSGDLKRSSKGLTKEDDYRIAHVTLPAGQKFEWPDLFPKEKMEEEKTDYEATLKDLNKSRQVDPNSRGLPTWLS